MNVLMQDPARFAALQAGYFAQQATLWSSLLGQSTASVVDGERGDKRFAAREWRDNPYYSYLRQSYLLTTKFLTDLVEAAPLEPQMKERMQFAVKQWCDAMAPSNFAATNPA